VKGFSSAPLLLLQVLDSHLEEFPSLMNPNRARHLDLDLDLELGLGLGLGPRTGVFSDYAGVGPAAGPSSPDPEPQRRLTLQQSQAPLDPRTPQ